MLGARRTERIQTLADELQGQGGKAIALQTDVTHADAESNPSGARACTNGDGEPGEQVG